jgi:DNA-directed RNA polymerase subunit RPC12/RpoP
MSVFAEVGAIIALTVVNEGEIMNPSTPLDRDLAKQLFAQYRKQRDGIRKRPELASLCLICGSVHIIPDKEPGMLICRDCRFVFYRYECTVCGKTVDGRDPKNPACRECGGRVCTCPVITP